MVKNAIIINQNWAKSSGGKSVTLAYPQDIAKMKHQAPVLFIGGVHGDEPEGVQLANSLLTWIQNCANLPQIPWYLIPCLNVDGYEMSPRVRTNAAGVDLNRNFPSSDWSPNIRAPRYNPGASPASESEVRAVVELIDSLKPKIVFHFHSHSTACIIHTGAAGLIAAKIFETVTQYPAQPEIGYATPGSLGQYGWFDKKIPVICIEELEGISLDSIWPRFEPAFFKFWNDYEKII